MSEANQTTDHRPQTTDSTPARWTAEEHAIFKREFEAQAEDVPFQERQALAQVLIHKMRRKHFTGPSRLPWNMKAYAKGKKATDDRRLTTDDSAKKPRKISIKTQAAPGRASGSATAGVTARPPFFAQSPRSGPSGAPAEGSTSPSAHFEQYTLTECLAALSALGKRITAIADQIREAAAK